jgi:arylsulfatase A-like enzyme
MYEGGIRVPLIARWTGTVAPGQVVDHPTYFPDFFPTFVTLAGAAVPERLDGLSLVPLLKGEGDQPKHEVLYWEWPTYNWREQAYTDNGLMQAVRKDDWKMLRHTSDAPWELYDLSRDIGEENNIAGDHPEVIEELTAWIAENRAPMPEQVEPTPPAGRKFR